ncbi:MAG: transposase [Planctomycetes bacterium]|nr:transposase [Planctomycetota bacterium]
MKKSKFNETKILAILKEAEAGMTVAEISRKYGISNGTFYNWKSKFAGMSGSEIRRMRQLEQENNKLKHMYADLSLENNVLKELIEKNF